MSHLTLDTYEDGLDINVGLLESTVFVLAIQMSLIFTNGAQYQFMIFLLIGVWNVRTVMVRAEAVNVVLIRLVHR